MKGFGNMMKEAQKLQAQMEKMQEEIGKKKPYGFWMKYQASARFGLAELLDAIAGLAEADVAMKSGQDARMALERVLVALLAPESRGRKTP